MQRIPGKNRFSAPAEWQSHILTAHPIFSDLCQRFEPGRFTDWPSVSALNNCRSDKAFSFVDNAVLEQDGRYYEEFIYATAQIPTRSENWHDLFGAMAWCLFPQTKKLLNRLHIAEINLHGQKQRSKLRNKLTLFDECGVILCVEPAAQHHLDWLRAHQWQHSFVQQRAEWWQQLKPVIFGHAIYEMATAPFIGLTAKALFVKVPVGFSQWPLTAAYSFLDRELHEQIANGAVLLDNQQLTPLPVLGVPGWHDDNNNPGFYDNTDYFRPRRQR
ncbi:DUF3025 domain-containing protein [Rheinheimera aquimaris]|jgi:hypothetical protein|uniref:DUF3025 domain-containing protein n=2 Tax=Rheinheimera aquimaris TaxID=412437 RepID=UPI001065724F|nr:DUF3025 domain-containing protein [Rheinheimera aquimaris]